MNHLDHMIRDALGAENAELFDKYGEHSIKEMVLDSFKGRTKWLVAITFVGIATFVALGLVSLTKFLMAEDLRDMLGWAMALVFCLMAVGMMKIWYWMELNKNTVLREIKRVELQIACLVERDTDVAAHKQS